MAVHKKYKQGLFYPKNQAKYKGSFPICYRSGLELSYMRFLDDSSNVVSWGSESVVIPYVKPTDGRVHKYFIDFNFTIKDRNGVLHKFLVEVKPAKQCNPPNEKGRKNKMNLLREQITYATNKAKWSAANDWAAKNGYKFTIVTETDIKNLRNR